MIYLKNNTKKQEVWIPRQDQEGAYVSPCEKCYQEGFEDGAASCGNIEEVEVVLTASTQTVVPSEGFVGMSEVFIDARNYGKNKYDEGYEEGFDEGLASCNELEEKDVVVTAATQTVLPSSGYDGMSEVYIDATEYGNGKYGEGYDYGHEVGFDEGQEAQKSKLASTAFTQNGIFTRADGWDEVTVNVADIPAVLQEKTENLETGAIGSSWTFVPDSGYEGMSKITIVDDGYGKEQFDLGWDERGLVMVQTAITQNGVYSTPEGYSEVTVNVPQTGSSCNLQDKSVTMTAKTQSILPSSGYDGMSAVTVDATDICGDSYDEGVADQKAKLTTTAITQNGVYSRADGFSEVTVNVPTGSSCNLQDKSVTMTAQTETFYPDGTAYEPSYIGQSAASWNINNLIDTGIYPDSNTSVRIKYKGRGQTSDRIIGSVAGYQDCSDSVDWRIFDAFQSRCWYDFGSNRISPNYYGVVTVRDTLYDFTMSNEGLYDNITDRWHNKNNGGYTPNTGYTICVDVGSIYVEEVIITKSGVVVFDGYASMVNGVVGLLDSVSGQLFTRYSGSTGSAMVFIEGQAASGYDGMSAITVDATDLCDDAHDDGYNEGYADGDADAIEQTDCIYYTTKSGIPITVACVNCPSTYTTFEDYHVFDEDGNQLNLVSNTYANGVGKLVYDGHIYKIDGQATDGVFLSGDAINNDHSGQVDSIMIPNGVRVLGGFTSEEIERIGLPVGLIEIREYFLTNSDTLKYIWMPDTVTGITGERCFECENLREVHISRSLLSMGNYTFWKCAKMASITLPASLLSIGNGAFAGCNTLSEIYCYATTAPTLGSGVFGDGTTITDHHGNPMSSDIATNGTLYVPAGSDYSTWLAQLPSGWTISATL